MSAAEAMVMVIQESDFRVIGHVANGEMTLSVIFVSHNHGQPTFSS